MTSRSCLFVGVGESRQEPLFMEGGRVTVGSVANSGLGGVRDANVDFFYFCIFFKLQVVLLTK